MRLGQFKPRLCRECGATHPDDFAYGRASLCASCRKRQKAATQRAYVLDGYGGRGLGREGYNRYQREWYAANSDVAKARVHRYARTPAGRMAHRMASLLRKARKRGAARVTRPDRAHLRTLLTDPCAYCGAPSTVIDHIVPLSRGGAHTVDNLVPACRPCNGEKFTSSLLMFMQRRAA